MNRQFGGVVAIAACAAVAVGLIGAAPAFADTPMDTTLESVANATPETIHNAAKVPTKERGSNAIDTTVSGAEVIVPVDPASGITLEIGGGVVSISLPYSSEAENAVAEKQGVVSYDNNNGSSSVPVVGEDGALQINTVIKNASAPSRYSYDLTIPAGGRIVSAGDGFFIVNAQKDPVAFIAEPWAKDANGRAVATHYELTDSTLTQVVDHTANGTAYPVVADPQFAWYGVLPSVKLTRSETKTATTVTGIATVCGWVARLAGYPAGIVCGANSISIISNAQRIYNMGKCQQLLIGPGVVGSVDYKDSYCR